MTVTKEEQEEGEETTSSFSSGSAHGATSGGSALTRCYKSLRLGLETLQRISTCPQVGTPWLLWASVKCYSPQLLFFSHHSPALRCDNSNLLPGSWNYVSSPMIFLGPFWEVTRFPFCILGSVLPSEPNGQCFLGWFLCLTGFLCAPGVLAQAQQEGYSPRNQAVHWGPGTVACPSIPGIIPQRKVG